MTVALCTLVLNEMEWLPKLYEQHKDWEGLVQWVFVESADKIYAETNPSMVSSSGLSVDGTTEWLEALALQDPRITHIKHGLSSHRDKSQGKCDSRNQYLRAIENTRPTYFIVVDADEFYIKKSQNQIIAWMDTFKSYDAFVFKHRDIWRPASIIDSPLFRLEVVGGFWSIPYCRCWRWYPKLQYKTNHNTPELPSRMLDDRMKRFDKEDGAPFFIHMGFASDAENRKAKNEYYKARGESLDTKRSWYCDSRACFETWRPGDKLPMDAKVIYYNGSVPECFL